MTEATDQQLELAYQFINDERLDDATAILRPILAAEPGNADAWWLMANAASDPEEAREALQRVLEINPNHAQAKDLMAQLGQLYPPVPEAAYGSFDFGESADFDNLYGDADVSAAAPPLPPEMPGAQREESRIGRLSAEAEGTTPALDISDLFGEEGEAGDELPSFEGEPDFLGATTEARIAPRRSQRRTGRLVRLALVAAILAIAVFAVILIVGQTPAPGPTSLDVQVTMVPNPTASDTVQVVLDAAQSAASAQTRLLGGPTTTSLEEGDLGATLVIQVCRPAGTDLPQAMTVAMETAARYGVAAQDEIAAVGAHLINCDRDDLLMSAVAPMDQAAAFANGSISADTFRASWQWSP